MDSAHHLDAHLDLETHAGNAWIGLKGNLGQQTPTMHENEFHLKRASPSRIRRRERRAASFKQQDGGKMLDKAVSAGVHVTEQVTNHY